MIKTTSLFIILIVVISNTFLFCESAKKIRYHKEIKRKARNLKSERNSAGVSDNDGGDVFAFLSYYRPEEDIDLARYEEEARSGRNGSYAYDYGFSDDDIIPEYDDATTPNTTPRNNPTGSLSRTKPLNVRMNK